MSKNLTDFTVEQLKDYLSANLPPIIAREKVSDYLGGLIASSSLQKYDCLGTGDDEFRIFDAVDIRRSPDRLMPLRLGCFASFGAREHVVDRVYQLPETPARHDPQYPRRVQMQCVCHIGQSKHDHLERYHHGECTQQIEDPGEQVVYPCDVPCEHGAEQQNG